MRRRARWSEEDKDLNQQGRCPVTETENKVGIERQNETRPVQRRLSLDSWAVILGLALAVLVRLGVLKHVEW